MKDFSNVQKGDFLVHFHRDADIDEHLDSDAPYLVQEVKDDHNIFVYGMCGGLVASDLIGWVPGNWEKIKLEPFQKGDVLVRVDDIKAEYVFQKYEVVEGGYLRMAVDDNTNGFTVEIGSYCVEKSPFGFLELKKQRQQQSDECDCGSPFEGHAPFGIRCWKGLR